MSQLFTLVKQVRLANVDRRLFLRESVKFSALPGAVRPYSNDSTATKSEEQQKALPVNVCVLPPTVG
jgi:hypothetical protein